MFYAREKYEEALNLGGNQSPEQFMDWVCEYGRHIHRYMIEKAHLLQSEEDHKVNSDPRSGPYFFLCSVKSGQVSLCSHSRIDHLYTMEEVGKALQRTSSCSLVVGNVPSFIS